MNDKFEIAVKKENYMGPWFKVKKKDVIAILNKNKNCFPWGGRSDEKYRCLVFWEDGVVRMTVDEFYEADSVTYECLRFYTTIIGNTIDEYTKLTEEELSSKAYNAWCSGAR